MPVDRFKIPVDDDCELSAAVAWPKEPRAIAVAVPVVGGTAGQQIKLFRELGHHHIAVASFTYRGHGDSGGRFRMPQTAADLATSLAHFKPMAEARGLSMHLIGTSFASYPILINLMEGRAQGVRSYCPIGGFPTTHEFLAPLGLFYGEFAQRYGYGRDTGEFIDFVRRTPGELDLGIYVVEFSKFFAQYLPGVTLTSDRFEALEFDRADPVGEIQEYGRGYAREDLQFHTDLPALWIHGRRDPVIGLFDDAAVEEYQQRIRQVSPGAEILCEEIDHWIRGPGNAQVLKRLGEFILANSEQPSTAAT